MSVRPIDIQNSMMRSPDAKKIYHDQQEKNMGIGVNHPDVIEEEIQEEQRKVAETDASVEGKAIKDDEKSNSNNPGASKKKKKSKPKEVSSKKPVKDGIHGNIIDVKAYY